jgi:hypothetical protein
MAFSDYSPNPNNNTSIGGINIAENCPAANLNNAMRVLAADGKLLANEVAGLGGGGSAAFLPLSGGTVTGAIQRAGAGAYLHHASSGNTSGAIHIIASGGALPSGLAAGDIILEVE